MYSRNLRYWLDKWPGKKTLGVYRFLPLFFILGATLEFSMISVRIGTTNFCKYRLMVWPYITKPLILLDRFNFQPKAGWKNCSKKAGSGRLSKMPAGVSLASYSKFFIAAMLAMLAGSQTIHVIYRFLHSSYTSVSISFWSWDLLRPMDNMDALVKEEMDRLTKLLEPTPKEVETKISFAAKKSGSMQTKTSIETKNP